MQQWAIHVFSEKAHYVRTYNPAKPKQVMWVSFSAAALHDNLYD